MAGVLAVAGDLAVLPSPAGAASRPGLPVFSWELVGGFVPPIVTMLSAPRLVVYDDHTAVADAARRLRLNGAMLAEVRFRAIEVLADPANLRRRPGAPVIADAPATRFEALAMHGARRYRAVVEALAEYRDQHAYPQPLYDLLDLVTELRTRILATGRPFRPAAVRLVVVRVDQANDPVGDWPSGVPVPVLDPISGMGHEDLHGRTARRLTYAVQATATWSWPTLRTADGTLLLAAWRYLLPHE
jgi:hypothetical protein